MDLLNNICDKNLEFHKKVLGFIPEENKSQLKNIAFVLITPDSIQRRIVGDVIDYLLNHANAVICAAKSLYITERQVEELYRYTFQKPRNELTYLWLIKKAYTSGPCIALILYGDEHEETTLCEKILNIKGSYSKVNKYSKETLRRHFKSISRVLSLIHSSDNSFELIRESKIFFSEEEILKILSNKQKRITKSDVLNLVYEKKSYKNASELVQCIINRMYTALLIDTKNRFSNEFFYLLKTYINRKEPLSTYKQILDSIREYNFFEFERELIILNLIFYLKGDFDNFKIESIVETMKEVGIYISPWEGLILENELYFSRYV